MSRATRPILTAVVLIAALAATGTAQEGYRRAPAHRSSGHASPSGGNGLLGAFFKPAPHPQRAAPTSRTRSVPPQSAVQPVGLLDRLRAFTDGEEPSRPASLQPAVDTPDWTGVPYHQPHGPSGSSAPQPIRDPSGRTVGSGVASQSRSHSSRVVVQGGSANRSSAGAIPTPPSEADVAARSSRPAATAKPEAPLMPERPAFSETQSSRRSDRRAVEPLSETAAAVAELEPAIAAPNAPRVAQRAVPTSTQASGSSTSARRPGGGTPPSLAAASGAVGGDAPAAAVETAKEAPIAAPPSESLEATVALPTMAAPEASLAANAGMRLDAGDGSAAGSAPVASVARDVPSADAVPALEPVPAAAADPWQAAGTDAKVTAERAAESPQVTLDTHTVGSGVAAGSGPSLRTAATTTAADDTRSAATDVAAATGTNAVSSELPGVRVINQGPANLMIRQVTEYEIRIENRGATEAPGVFVRTVLPDWVDLRGHHASRGDVSAEQNKNERLLLWQVDRLPAGGTERLSLRLAAERSGTFDVAIDWTLLPQTNIAHVRVQEPKLQLLIEGPDEVVYGESATYKVRVLNPGDGPAPNVAFTLSPNSATPQTQQIGNIPPGKEAQFEVQLAAQDLGDLQIHGLATADLSLRTEATKNIRVAAAKLEAVLSGPELKYQDAEASYELKVLNNGAATSRQVTARLRLPSGVRYLGGLDGAQLSGDLLSWQIDQLAPGDSRQYAFRCQMASTGSHLLAFDCSGTGGGTATVSITTMVEALADLVLTVADPPAPAPVGSQVTYEVLIRNRGSKAASDVNVVTHFSNGIEPVSVEGHAGEISLGQVQFATIPRIEAGQELRLRVVAQAATEGLHRFRTEVTAGDTVLVAEEATRYLSATTEKVSRRSSDSSQR